MRKSLSILLIVSILLSSFACTFSASEYDTNTAENKTSNLILRATGDVAVDPDDLPDGLVVIDSMSDYYKVKADNSEGKKDIAATSADTLPAFVDNSSSPYFPAIGNQGELGSCQFWAQVYYQFTYTMNKDMGVTTTAANTFSPQWAYNIVAGTDDMLGTFFDLYTMMKVQGNVFQSQVPYTLDKTSYSPTEDIWKTSIRYRLKDYQKFEDIGKNGKEITSPDDPDLAVIKTALSNGDVLTYSTYIHSWQFTTLRKNASAPENSKYTGQQVAYGDIGSNGSHRMTLVGYNDNIWVDINGNNTVDNGEMGAFKIANSWGNEWGNSGFMWVAYDALNAVSCVKGVGNQEKRNPIFNEICRIDVLKQGTDSQLYLKYTLNTADRTQVRVNITAEKDGTPYSRQAYSNVHHGAQIAYDGSNTATDATMVALLSNTVEGITSENLSDYSFSVVFKDEKNDSNIFTVKDVQLVDEVSGKIYTPKNTFPLTLNGEEKTVKFTESDLNHAVIYYRGYDSPQLNYKVKGDADFTNVLLFETTERRGYTHKYVIDLKDSDSATLYFAQDNGDKDDNNGRYYQAKRGLNYYATENVAPPLNIGITNDYDGEIDVNRGCNFSATASGGYAPYMYQFTFTHLDSGEQTVETFDDTENQIYYFRQEGRYEIKLEVKDFSDNIATQTMIVEVTDVPFSFEKMYTEKTSNLVSDTVDIIAVSQNEKIRYTGKVNNTYDFVVTDEDGNICHKNTVNAHKHNLTQRYTHSKVSFVPHKSGTYKATVCSTDNNNEYAEYSITFEVFDKRYGDSNADGEISVMDATTIQRLLAGNITENEINRELSDCDSNNEVDVLDATLIQRFVAQLSNTKNTGNIIEYIPPVEPTEPPTEPTEPPTEEPEVTRTVTFTNSFNWGGTISCYYWSDSNMAMTSWPGMKMTLVGTNDFGESMYTFEVPQGATYIIFTNGSSQTTDITYSGGEVRYYPIATTDSKGHNMVSTW